MKRALFFLLLPLCAFAETEWEPGNEFNFAVSVQYDVEPDVISAGVGGALTNAMGDISSITNQIFEQPPPVWTNYDTNGLPSEIFAQPVQSSISSNGTTSASSFGFSGIDDVLSGNFGDIDDLNSEVELPIITGYGLSTQKTSPVAPMTVPGADEGIQYFLDAVFDVENYSGPFPELYAGFVESASWFAQKCRESLHFRSWSGQVCAALSLVHLFWASAIIGSGIFRAFVAGLTGISGGK